MCHAVFVTNITCVTFALLPWVYLGSCAWTLAPECTPANVFSLSSQANFANFSFSVYKSKYSGIKARNSPDKEVRISWMRPPVHSGLYPAQTARTTGPRYGQSRSSCAGSYWAQPWLDPDNRREERGSAQQGAFIAGGPRSRNKTWACFVRTQCYGLKKKKKNVPWAH